MKADGRPLTKIVFQRGHSTRPLSTSLRKTRGFIFPRLIWGHSPIAGHFWEITEVISLDVKSKDYITESYNQLTNVYLICVLTE